MLQNKTRTRKVGYQGHFVDDAEVLQQNRGAAEQEQEQERLVTRGVFLMVLRSYNGTLMQQKKTTHQQERLVTRGVLLTLLRYNRTRMQQTTTITKSVGYQGRFAHGADVLHQNLGAAEQNSNKKGWLPGPSC